MPKRDHHDRLTIIMSSVAAAAAAVSCAISIYGQMSSNKDIATALGQMANLAKAANKQAEQSALMSSTAREQMTDIAALADATAKQATASVEQVTISRNMIDISEFQRKISEKSLKLNKQSLVFVKENQEKISKIENSKNRPYLSYVIYNSNKNRVKGEIPKAIELKISNDGILPAKDAKFYYNISIDVEYDGISILKGNYEKYFFGTSQAKYDDIIKIYDKSIDLQIEDIILSYDKYNINSKNSNIISITIPESINEFFTLNSNLLRPPNDINRIFNYIIIYGEINYTGYSDNSYSEKICIHVNYEFERPCDFLEKLTASNNFLEKEVNKKEEELRSQEEKLPNFEDIMKKRKN